MAWSCATRLANVNANSVTGSPLPPWGFGFSKTWRHDSGWYSVLAMTIVSVLAMMAVCQGLCSWPNETPMRPSRVSAQERPNDCRIGSNKFQCDCEWTRNSDAAGITLLPQAGPCLLGKRAVPKTAGRYSGWRNIDTKIGLGSLQRDLRAGMMAEVLRSLRSDGILFSWQSICDMTRKNECALLDDPVSPCLWFWRRSVEMQVHVWFL
ncbi:hypothetical protein LIA77_02481 [Sarocladium implicatum]|nr:hypothetical protein LIA77_02481 [Sarocladium implicatum]